MPAKESNKKRSTKRAPAETALVPHAAPELATLLKRAAGGKLSDVQQYLNAGGSPNVLEPMEKLGLAPLLSAVAVTRHKEAAASIKLLLQAGASVDATSSSAGIWERTALMVACSVSDDLKTVQALLAGGADPCYQAGSDGITALHLAATVGCTDVCRELCTASSNRVLALTNKSDGCSATPLIAACVLEQHAVVKLLCELRANVHHGDAAGNTPLMVAAEGPSTSVLQLLLQQSSINVNQRNDTGDTALVKAACTGNAAAVRLLLQHGADACSINNSCFSTVFAAAIGGDLQILELLIQHGADVRAVTDRGFTLLMQAATDNQPRVAEFLIQQGLSVHAVDDSGSTALHHAAASASKGTETMRVLLAHGADVNAVDLQRCTPLHLAARSEQLDKVEVLVAAGADVLRTDEIGGTALHVAIHFEHLTVVQLLLEHGADVVINTLQYTATDEHSPVSAVMVCNDAAVLKLLLTAGADVHAVTSSGDTCLHIAARHSYSAPVLCLLIKAGADLQAVNEQGLTAAEVAHDACNTLLEQLLNRAAQQA
eukprot:15599-Heterococcus_DN1.PRE.2